jgi:hypothetical protein
MQTYSTTAIITAKPMSKRDYDTYRGLSKPGNADETIPGFLWECSLGATNHLNHKGFISWLPELEFLAKHTEVPFVEDRPSHEQRVMAEHVELDKKLNTLKAYFKSDKFLKITFAERELLQEQSRLMAQYLCVLEARISNFR